LKSKALALIIICILTMASAAPLFVYSLPPPSHLDAKRGAYVDQECYTLMKSPVAQKVALLRHDIDVSGIPLPEDMRDIMDAGFTITKMPQIGWADLTFPNNRVWPFGIPYIYIDPNDPQSGYKDPAWLEWEDEAESFRKALHRLIDVDQIVSDFYTQPCTGVELKSKAERWLPPGMETWTAMGQEPWIPDVSTPPFDPCAAAALLDAAGFVQGSTPNPYYDPDFSCSAEYMRIDPKTGEDLDFEYYAIGPVDSPLGFKTAELISKWFKRAGVGHHLVAGTWRGMVIRLVNPDLHDYEFMTGMGMYWGTRTPDILRDFTYSRNLPLWNFVYYNNSDVDYWGDEMMRTLNLTRGKECAVRIQEILRDEEPYMPLLLTNNFAAITGPWAGGAGGIRIVNMAGQGIGLPHSNCGLLIPNGQIQTINIWNKQRMWAGRTLPSGEKINKGVYSCEIFSLNPLEADCEVDWTTCLGKVMGGFWGFTPFLRDYVYLGVLDEHKVDLWIGPGSSEYVEGNGVYDAPFNGTHYDGIPIADVTTSNLVGDDVLGMETTWRLRDDLYWHDSDPGPDGVHGTGDEPSGSVHKVTTADMEYAARVFMGKEYPEYENLRYYSSWTFFAGYTDTYDGPFAVEIVDDQTFTIYEERRYVFAFEGHDSTLAIVPKHIWEPYIEGPDATKGTEDDGDPAAWTGWEDDYMIDPVRQRLGLSEMHLTHLIGYGPFVYHLGGWTPGVSTAIEYNPLYFAGKINPGDVDLEFFYNPELPEGLQRYGYVDFADYGRLLDARDNNVGGWAGGIPNDPMWDPTADLAGPAQVVQMVAGYDISSWYASLGERWGPGYPLDP